jgi:aconitate hydratase
VAEKAREAGESIVDALPEIESVIAKIKEKFDIDETKTGIGSTIYAVKPGDGSAREQAASCQKVLGGWANFAKEYATKRYRSNLINWGMLPFVFPNDKLPFANGDYIFIPEIKKAIREKKEYVDCYVINRGFERFKVTLGELTDDERDIIIEGCLINYNRNK